ncbi:ribonuclease Z [Halorarum halophilum]|uniref:Ribonuclease Z n=1 Tax=Halorarum halophilum TaxID=2743090 RepID=A0A7D5K8L6_9EURY|nr:ribonuclease Z [Halobaculum halophilum]QLG28294.1 ribonuclease Z [Halobaculum halophilum]
MTLRVTFLGTSGAVPTVERAPSAIHVNCEGEELLFDCGEGTQRQMMRYGTGFGLSHVFLTHLHGDHILGLPGLVQSLDFNDREEALAIHGPPGSKRTIRQLVHAGGHDPNFPIRIDEVRPGNVALAREEYQVRTFETDHRTTSMGFVLAEADRKGRFDREKAEEELNIPPGPAYGKLHGGEPVELDDGTVVRPEEVVGPPRPGRTVVYTGDTRPVEATVEAAADADLLVHDATFAGDDADRARQTAHSTAVEAAEIARRAGAKRLALTHISSRYAARAGLLESEAKEVFAESGFDGQVFVPDDGDEVEVPFPDADG